MLNQTTTLVLLCMALTAVSSGQDVGNEEAIKHFISNPPRILDMLFEVRRNRHFPTKVSTNYWSHKYAAKVDGEQVYLRGLASFEEAGLRPDAGWPERVILVSSPRGSWTLCGGSLFEMPDRDLPSFWAEEKQALFREKAAFRHVNEVLNLGVTEVPAHTIRWQGNTFSFTNISQVIVRGVLVSSNRTVTGMTLIHSYRGSDNEYRLSYDYGLSSDVGFLPNRILRSIIRNGQEIIDREYLITRCELAKEPIPPEVFSNSEFLSFAKHRLAVKNGVVLTRGPNSLEPLRDATNVTFSTNRYRQTAIFGAFLLFATTMLVFWWRDKTKPEKQTS